MNWLEIKIIKSDFPGIQMVFGRIRLAKEEWTVGIETNRGQKQLETEHRSMTWPKGPSWNGLQKRLLV